MKDNELVEKVADAIAGVKGFPHRTPLTTAQAIAALAAIREVAGMTPTDLRRSAYFASRMGDSDGERLLTMLAGE